MATLTPSACINLTNGLAGEASRPAGAGARGARGRGLAPQGAPRAGDRRAHGVRRARPRSRHQGSSARATGN